MSSVVLTFCKCCRPCPERGREGRLDGVVWRARLVDRRPGHQVGATSSLGSAPTGDVVTGYTIVQELTAM